MRLDWSDFRHERVDFRPERADFRLERADFRPQKTSGGQMYGNSGLCFKGHRPFAAAVQNRGITPTFLHFYTKVLP